MIGMAALRWAGLISAGLALSGCLEPSVLGRLELVEIDPGGVSPGPLAAHFGHPPPSARPATEPSDDPLDWYYDLRPHAATSRRYLTARFRIIDVEERLWPRLVENYLHVRENYRPLHGAVRPRFVDGLMEVDIAWRHVYGPEGDILSLADAPTEILVSVHGMVGILSSVDVVGLIGPDALREAAAELPPAPSE